jgi:hypothetical protein
VAVDAQPEYGARAFVRCIRYKLYPPYGARRHWQADKLGFVILARLDKCGLLRILSDKWKGSKIWIPEPVR